jgi:hypothetical protein
MRGPGRIGLPPDRDVGYPSGCRKHQRRTAGCPSGQRERSVKPSASPTQVRTLDLPPPAKTARMLRKRGPAGRFLLVTPCIRVRHRGSMRGSGYGHIADSVRAERAVRQTARFAVRRHPPEGKDTDPFAFPSLMVAVFAEARVVTVSAMSASLMAAMARWTRGSLVMRRLAGTPSGRRPWLPSGLDAALLVASLAAAACTLRVLSVHL